MYTICSAANVSKEPYWTWNNSELGTAMKSLPLVSVDDGQVLAIFAHNNSEEYTKTWYVTTFTCTD